MLIFQPIDKHRDIEHPCLFQYVTGAAQVVDASRVVFAFARDNALPGSRYWKRMNHYTQTPVNAVWAVIGVASVCGVLGFSATALTSLASYVLYSSYGFFFLTTKQVIRHWVVHFLCRTDILAYNFWQR